MPTTRNAISGPTTLVLAAIVAVSVALAAYWALRVPVFQRPDEHAHADYAFMLADVGRPFTVARAKLSFEPVTPQVRYLEDAASYRQMRYNPYARAPHGYGTPEFVRSLDAHAPPPRRLRPAEGSALPYVMFAYPSAFYVLMASAAAAFGSVTHGSLWWTFIGMRLLNAAMLGLTLPMIFALLRETNVRTRPALIATAAAGTFPLVSWVAGYVQPDNLSLLLVTAAMLIGARTARLGLAPRRAAALVAVLVLLMFTKQHYGIAVWLACAAIVLTRASRTPWAALAVLALPPAAFVAAFHATPAAGTLAARSTLAHAGVSGPASVLALAPAFVHGFIDEFAGGNGFRDYWLYDVRDFPALGAGGAKLLVTVLSVASLAVALAFATAWLATLRRIARVVVRRSASRGARLIASAVAPNTYVVTTLVILTAYAMEHEHLWLEGRYWLPVTGALYALVVGVVPRLVRGPARNGIATSVACVLLFTSVSLSALLLAAMNRNFYGPGGNALRVDRFAGITAVAGRHPSAGPLARATVRARKSFVVAGYAVDPVRGLPSRHIDVTIDGEAVPAVSYGQATPWLQAIYNDGALAKAGFRIVVPSQRLAPGTHRIRIAVAIGNGRELAFPDRLDVRAVADSAVTTASATPP